MQNIDKWTPTKFHKKNSHYKPNLKNVGIPSYYICNTYIDHYVRYIQKYSSGIFLDCGCGSVPYYEIYKDQVNEVICTDWQQTKHDNQHVDVYSDLNEGLNFEDRSFDTVLLTDVLEHIYTPAKLINDIFRVLKPGGKVIIAVPFLYKIHEEPYDYHRYTEFSLRRMCQESGLRIIEFEPYGTYFDVLFDTVNKVFIRSRYILPIFMSFTSLVKKSWLNKKVNHVHGNNYALGYILAAEKAIK